MPTCVQCGTTDQEAALLAIVHKGNTVHICSSCLPVLIHHPERVMDKLVTGPENAKKQPGQ